MKKMHSSEATVDVSLLILYIDCLVGIAVNVCDYWLWGFGCKSWLGPKIFIEFF